MDPALDRALCHIHDSRRFFIGQTLGSNEQQRLALIRGQLLKCCQEIPMRDFLFLVRERGESSGVGALCVLDFSPPLSVLTVEVVP
jgi:hypothetical protein